jgi:hypothetical protein
MFQSFYSTVAQTAFTLLGLWWVALQIRYGPWMRDRRVRRAVYDISLYFFLPGTSCSRSAFCWAPRCS